MFRDDDMFPPTVFEELGEIPGVTPVPDQGQEQQHINDAFDDVFGSPPASPSLNPTTFEGRSGNLEPSDIPRLREKHETEGYRDGVTNGKGQSVQAGFDEGYSLGATLGMKCGRILGILEGVVHATAVGGADFEEERARLEILYTTAQEELNAKSVFGSEYWKEDGIWKFEVPGEKEGKDVVFPDVVMAHPLVKKWWVVMEKEMVRWNLDAEILDKEHDTLDADDGREEQAAKRVIVHKEVASEPVAGAGMIGAISKADLNW